jgi:hypothetical protein
MEPAPSRPDSRTDYLIPARIKRLELRYRHLRTVKDPTTGDPVSVKEEIGWFCVFEGSWEALFISKEKPDLYEGQAVTIRISSNDRKTSSTP